MRSDLAQRLDGLFEPTPFALFKSRGEPFLDWCLFHPGSFLALLHTVDRAMFCGVFVDDRGLLLKARAGPLKLSATTSICAD